MSDKPKFEKTIVPRYDEDTGGSGGPPRDRPHNTFSITLDGQSDQSGKGMPPKHPDGEDDAADAD